jgi:CheY-like chemotaxis protein
LERKQVILVVDDNLPMRKALVESLQILNYITLEAGNGQEALEILKQEASLNSNAPKVSLILSDLSMPEMDGTELFHHLKKNNIDIPLVLLSGYIDSRDLSKLIGEGLAGWLMKPVGLGELAGLLNNLLKEINEK